MFANGPGNKGSNPGQVIPKTQKKLLDATLLNTQHYKVWIKGKVEQSGETFNCVFMLNWTVWNRTVLTLKLCTYAKLNCLK